MVREAALQNAIRVAGFSRLAEIVAVCEDESVLGVPFYVMRYLDGHVITGQLPPDLEDEAARRKLGNDLVDALVEIHAADVTTRRSPSRRSGLLRGTTGPPLPQLWELNKTRELAVVDEVSSSLARAIPEPLAPTVVHGDYRLGNMMVARDEPTRIEAVLDWEMVRSAIREPTSASVRDVQRARGARNPLGTSPVTDQPGFPTRAELAKRYAQRSGRDVEPLGWFEALALWKAAVFCEAIYGRFIRGELGSEDTLAARFEAGVPLLAETALQSLRG